MYVREPVDLTRSEMLMLSSPATVFATSTPCIMMWFLTVLQQHSMMNECWTMNMGAGLTNNVVWCGAVWCGDSGAVSCGVGWCVVRCGVVHGVARCDIAWRGVVSRSERCGTVVSGAVVSVVAWWCGVVWCGVVWRWCAMMWCGMAHEASEELAFLKGFELLSRVSASANESHSRKPFTLSIARVIIWRHLGGGTYRQARWG
jgi:hypothetical protein